MCREHLAEGQLFWAEHIAAAGVEVEGTHGPPVRRQWQRKARDSAQCGSPRTVAREAAVAADVPDPDHGGFAQAVEARSFLLDELELVELGGPVVARCRCRRHAVSTHGDRAAVRTLDE